MLSAAGDDILWSCFVWEQMEQTKKQFAIKIKYTCLKHRRQKYLFNI